MELRVIRWGIILTCFAGLYGIAAICVWLGIVLDHQALFDAGGFWALAIFLAGPRLHPDRWFLQRFTCSCSFEIPAYGKWRCR